MIYNKNNLLALNIASNDTAREEINGVLFKRDRTVATDGYILLEVKNNDGVINALTKQIPNLPDNSKPYLNMASAGVILPAKSCKKILQNIKEIKNDELPILSNCWFLTPNNDTSRIATTDLEKSDTVTTKNINGQFPNYDQIMPKGKAQATVKVDVKKLKQLVDTLGAMDLEDNAVIEISIIGKEKPVMFKANGENRQEITGLVMPVRQ